MINIITAAKGKLDNPLMWEWAIRYYNRLPKSAESERFAIEETGVACRIDRQWRNHAVEQFIAGVSGPAFNWSESFDRQALAGMAGIIVGNRV